MPILDFKEIQPATGGAGRDQFELFAREFLKSIGFKIITNPDRGADAGRDLVVEEVRTGVVGETRVRWLVSCKHKAHSGASVTSEDEQDIHDRVRTHECSGFLAFYSTVPSSGLAAKLNASNLPFEVQVFDQESIEKELLTSSGIELAKRFFLVSVAAWQKENPGIAKIFADEPALFCCYCNKSLLKPEPHGIVVVWTTVPDGDEKKATEHVYWCCRGQCDRALQEKYRRRNLVDGWEEITDLIAPIAYIRWVTVIMNEFQRGESFSEKAFDDMKTFFLNLFPFVAREMTAKERKRITELAIIPNYLGGWGY
jgi:Restriction endonuclease